jgi:hypothetical protein
LVVRRHGHAASIVIRAGKAAIEDEMKKYIFAIAIIAVCYVGSGHTNETLNFADASTARAEAIATAFREQRSGVQVAGEGVVVRILPDDSDGHRHQRFILSLASGQTLLVAHNIDIAPRLTSLKSGDLVAFNGVYEWNAKGGTVHWTHRDPTRRHPGGWLKHSGQTYQ